MSNSIMSRFSRIVMASFLTLATVFGVSVSVAPVAEAARLTASTNESVSGNIRLTLNGRREVGNSLSAVLTNVPNNAIVRFQWFRNGSTLSGATNRGRGITTRDAGAESMVRATITQPGRADIVLRARADIRIPAASPEVLTAEQRIFEEMNRVRAAEGLPAFIRHPLLDEVARAHSNDMLANRFFSHNSNRFNHISSLLGGCTRRFGLGENIASTSSAPVALWLNSPGHRRPIMDGNMRYIGIGVANHLTTVNFVNPHNVMGTLGNGCPAAIEAFPILP